MTTEKLNELRNELSIKSKNGIDFTLAASLIWLLIAFLWTLEFRAYDRSIICIHRKWFTPSNGISLF
jgi:hypothetical protein